MLYLNRCWFQFVEEELDLISKNERHITVDRNGVCGSEEYKAFRGGGIYANACCVV